MTNSQDHHLRIVIVNKLLTATSGSKLQAALCTYGFNGNTSRTEKAANQSCQLSTCLIILLRSIKTCRKKLLH